MKRARPLLALAAAWILGTAGCGQTRPENTASPVTDGISCRATIQYQDMELEAAMTRDSDGRLLLDFTAPKTLAGIALGWDGKEMTLELGGMRMAVPVEQVPQAALLQRLQQLLSDNFGGGTLTDGVYVLTGSAGGEEYALTCDPVTGLPLTLTATDLTVTFSDVKRLAAEEEHTNSDAA